MEWVNSRWFNASYKSPQFTRVYYTQEKRFLGGDLWVLRNLWPCFMIRTLFLFANRISFQGHCSASNSSSSTVQYTEGVHFLLEVFLEWNKTALCFMLTVVSVSVWLYELDEAYKLLQSQFCLSVWECNKNGLDIFCVRQVKFRF